MSEIEDDNLLVSAMRFTVRPENRKEFFQTVTPLMRKIQGEEGCLDFAIFEETKDENSFVVIGEWQTRISWNDHTASDNYAVFQGLATQLSVRSKTNFRLLVPVQFSQTRNGTN